MTQKTTPTPADPAVDRTPAPSEQGSGHGDGLLNSIGKAITAPIEGAAEPDEKAVNTSPAKPGK